MSGIFVAQCNCPRDYANLASRLCAQVSSGSESLRRYAVDDRTLLGVSTHDHLKQGEMPVYDPDAGVWVLLEGTLYRTGVEHAHHQLGGTECSSVARLFAALYRSGKLASALPGLNGAFFVVLWDPRERTLIACNDRFGLYPNYWSYNGERFCLAGRVLCSVVAGVVPGEWNPTGVAQLLTTGDISGEDTAIAGVQTFPQASVMTKREGQEPVFTRYWRYDFTPHLEGKPLATIAEQLGDAFVESVRRQSADVGRVGVTLSGGLDSRSIAAALHKLGQPVTSMTYGKPGALDRKLALKTADRLGANHFDCDYRYERLAEQYEAFGRTSEAMASLLDAHMLAHIDGFAKRADVILNGYAGDLLLGGSYLRRAWMRSLPKEALADKLFHWRNSFVKQEHLSQVLAATLDDDALPSHRYARLLEATAAESTPDLVDAFFLENRVRRNTAIGTVLMRREVESAACFFDYDFVDLTTSVPATLRKEHRAYIAMLRTSLPRAVEDSWQRTLLRPDAPVAAAIGAKAVLKGLRLLESKFGVRTVASAQSFTAFDEWFRGPLKEFLERICMENCPVADEILKPQFCEAILREHLAGVDRSGLIGIVASIRSFSLALAQARAGGDAHPVVIREISGSPV